MRYTLSIIVAALFLSACAGSKTTEMSTEGAEFMGEAFKPNKVYSYDAMLAKLKSDGGFDGQVKTNVNAVCAVKGCWMRVNESPEQEEMFVKFKDYGFFMPLDLTGSVVMQGQAYYDTTSVDELRHYAEDEGLAAEEIAKIVKPEVELKFMASGVMLDKSQVK